MKVKAALLFHRNVSAMTEVDTKDKIVTLYEVISVIRDAKSISIFGPGKARGELKKVSK